MVNGLDSFQNLDEKVSVVPKFAREGVGSYLVWLPCCPEFPSASSNSQPLCLYNVLAVNNAYLVCVWPLAREIDTWIIVVEDAWMMCISSLW